MEPIRIIESTMAPLPLANVDTDQIIPKQFLKRIERTGFGPYLFYDWARDVEGELDPGFTLNQEAYRTAAVLVSGPNFGTGSSREHAVWALEDRGFRAVIAPSFGDIFRTNCYKIGLLPIALSEEEVAALTALAIGDPAARVTVDLEAQTVTAEGVAAAFDIDPATRHRLLNGLDDIALTLQHAPAVDAYEAGRPAFKPQAG